MAEHSLQHISAATMDEIAQYLDPSARTRFLSMCQDADSQTLQTEFESLFSTWTTSLMDSDLARTEALSNNKCLRGYVKTLRIQDDCDKNDPWLTPEPQYFANVWPRDESGSICLGDIGIASLRAMLTERRLSPETIIIKDYRMSNANFWLCPPTTNIGDYRSIESRQVTDAKPGAKVAKDIVDGTGLPVVSISMQYVSLNAVDEAMRKLPDIPGRCLSNPHVQEVTIKFSTSYEIQEGPGFPQLLSADLSATPYWLEQVLYHAPRLESLKLFRCESWDILQSLGKPCFELKQLSITAAEIHADILLALLATSKRSLKGLSLKMVTLTGGTTWRDTLYKIGCEFNNLSFVSLIFPRQHMDCTDVRSRSRTQVSTITFLGFSERDVPEQCRQGLQLVEKGPPYCRRLTRVVYEGPNAGEVLKSLSAFAANHVYRTQA